MPGSGRSRSASCPAPSSFRRGTSRRWRACPRVSPTARPSPPRSSARSTGRRRWSARSASGTSASGTMARSPDSRSRGRRWRVSGRTGGPRRSPSGWESSASSTSRSTSGDSAPAASTRRFSGCGPAGRRRWIGRDQGDPVHVRPRRLFRRRHSHRSSQLMDPNRLRELLLAVQQGSVSADEALARLRRLPFEDLGYARLDTHRALRSGGPETVYCPGKTADQIVAILARLAESHANVLATRATPGVHGLSTEAGLRVDWHPTARILVANPQPVEGVGLVVVVSAGTSDLAVAEEAAVTAEVRGNRVERVYDAGVAGLHRLLAQHPLLLEAHAIVVVADR